MSTCPHCGAAHADDVLFCPQTGKGISVSRLEAGALVDGKYRIRRLIASGGMGAVYEVVHERIGRRLALKLILPELATSRDVAQRFEIEARAASAIGHENIVEITDMGVTAEGLPFLVMEYLDGRDLSSLLRQESPLPVARALRIVEQMLRALEAAHGRGIIHRDIKPENVFLIRRGDEDDFVKLLDFGISKFSDGEEAKLHLTSTGLILGTPYYMSPEQARGDRHLDHRSDLFSVGTILYQALTGERPFTGKNLNALLYQIISGAIVPPRQVRPGLPAALERVMLKALALEPADRFQTAAELRDALLDAPVIAAAAEPALRSATGPGLDGAAFTTTLPAAQARGPGRSGARWAALAAAAALVAGLAALGVWIARRSPPERPQAAPERRAGAAPDAAAPGPDAAVTVRVTLAVDPPTARILVEGRPLEGRVATFPRDHRTRQVRIEAEGHEPQDLAVVASRDRELFVNLRPRAATPDARVPEPGPSGGMDTSRPPPSRPTGMRDFRVVTEP